MGFFDQFLRDMRQVVFRNSEQNAIPSMDGALSPNGKLDQCTPIGDPLPGLDDVIAAPEGAVYASAGRRVYRLSGAGFSERAAVAEFDGDAGALALHPDGRLLVCVAGRGLAAVAPGGSAPRYLAAAGGHPLVGLTGVAAAPDGVIYMTEGSLGRDSDAWMRDLMEKKKAGRVLSCDAALESAIVLRDGLAWPNGVMVEAGGDAILYTEAWSHSVIRAPRQGAGIGASQPLAQNLVGYPARIHPAGGADMYLAFFGVRTHLIEFVLREDDFREDMMRTVKPEYWLGPALSSQHDCLEPMQIGSIKALGIQKPWAPPRSYGLLVRMNAQGEVVESLHSRADGANHGITAACDTPQGLVIASKGAGRLLLRGEERQ